MYMKQKKENGDLVTPRNNIPYFISFSSFSVILFLFLNTLRNTSTLLPPLTSLHSSGLVFYQLLHERDVGLRLLRPNLHDPRAAPLVRTSGRSGQPQFDHGPTHGPYRAQGRGHGSLREVSEIRCGLCRG